jgi:asparaginyl-tRNA synthetase
LVTPEVFHGTRFKDYSNRLIKILCCQKYEPASRSQLKKITKIFVKDSYKTPESEKANAADKEEQNLEEAKAIVIEEDKSLPPASLIKIVKATENRGKRVKIFGWVHRLRRQGNSPDFI